VNDNRPVNLDLTTIRLPLPAYTSILHRITGIVLFIAVAFALCALATSLQSATGFADIQKSMHTGFGSFVTWAGLSALAFHLVAGVKHLIMDLGIGETKEGGDTGAILTLIISAALIVYAGVWVWA